LVHPAAPTAYHEDRLAKDYRMGGIKKATKVQTKRGGESFKVEQISDFQVLEKVDPRLFTEPQ
jgi:hypothetical protein